MQNKKKLVSIILNCYNGERYLNEALTSVLNQTYKNWELIFWDNKSTDKSKIILKSFKNNRFKYFYSKNHTSLYKARNLAINKSRGQFISFIDADDTWDENKLLKQIKLFNEKNVAVVYGNSWIKNEKINKKKIFIKHKMNKGYIHDELIKSYNVGILTAVIKKKFIHKKKKIFNDKYNIIGDFDFFLKLSQKYKFNVIQEPVATYRVHDNNLSKLKKDIEIKEYEHWLRNNKKIINKKNFEIIKTKILHLKFIQLKFKKSFLKTLIFLIHNKGKIFNLKNMVILFLPKTILKKIMWFY